MNRKLCACLGILSLCAPGAYAKGDHLLISEVCLTPETAEFVEIANPGFSPVDLTNCYLADHGSYWKIVDNRQTILTGDFLARFPAGASIPARGVVTISVAGNTGFAAAFGRNADFEIKDTDATPNMRPAVYGSITPTAGLPNSGECVVLFSWNGQSDLVQDIDMVNAGAPTDATNSYLQDEKGGAIIDGPDADALNSLYPMSGRQMGSMSSNPGAGYSAQRLDAGEGSEIATGSGAGVTGDDETSENTLTTWHIAGPPTPGTAEGVAPVELSAFALE
jgi:hypothetical protein